MKIVFIRVHKDPSKGQSANAAKESSSSKSISLGAFSASGAT